jgi:FkbM family methyltransferase
MLRHAVKRALFGRRALQPFWQRLHRLSLAGLNVGGGSDFEDSGELWIIDRFARQRSEHEALIVFDVGANLGGWALAVLARLGAPARLLCFEPSPSSFAALTQNVGHRDDVECLNFGFGDREEDVELRSNAPLSGLASVYPRRLDHVGISLDRSERVRLRRLDDFCREREIDHIDFLKLDVEGHELKVLEGASGMVDSVAIDYIQFEFGGCNIDSRTYFQDFFYTLDPHYRLHRMLRHGLEPIEHYRETQEIFVTTNFLAISRKL